MTPDNLVETGNAVADEVEQLQAAQQRNLVRATVTARVGPFAGEPFRARVSPVARRLS
jgi:hypothetical protein